MAARSPSDRSRTSPASSGQTAQVRCPSARPGAAPLLPKPCHPLLRACPVALLSSLAPSVADPAAPVRAATIVWAGPHKAPAPACNRELVLNSLVLCVPRCRQIQSHGRCQLRHGCQYQGSAWCQGGRLSVPRFVEIRRQHQRDAPSPRHLPQVPALGRRRLLTAVECVEAALMLTAAAALCSSVLLALACILWFCCFARPLSSQKTPSCRKR